MSILLREPAPTERSCSKCGALPREPCVGAESLQPLPYLHSARKMRPR